MQLVNYSQLYMKAGILQDTNDIILKIDHKTVTKQTMLIKSTWLNQTNQLAIEYILKILETLKHFSQTMPPSPPPSDL